MNMMFQRLRDLGHKAAQLQQAVVRAPAKAAQLRDNLTLTAGQLQQMRTEMQSAVAGLGVDNEERLTQALREINEGAEVFLEAGYRLASLELELGLFQRFIVHLEKIADVDERTLRTILSANSERRTLSGALASLLKARALAGKTNLSGLDYRGVVIYVGQPPAVRLCWSADLPLPPGVQEEKSTRETPQGLVPSPPPETKAPTSTIDAAPSSFFEIRRTRGTSSSSAPHQEIVPPPLPEANVPPSNSGAPRNSVPPRKTLSGVDWKKESLDRFKTMPGASKYKPKKDDGTA